MPPPRADLTARSAITWAPGAASAMLAIGGLAVLGLNWPLGAAAGAGLSLLMLAVVAASTGAPPSGLYLTGVPAAVALAGAAAWVAATQGGLHGPSIRSFGQFGLVGELELLKLFGLAAATLAAALLAVRRDRARALLITLLIAGLLYMCLSLALRQHDPFQVWGMEKGPHRWRFTGSLLNANAAGCVFGMIALLGLGVLLPRLPFPQPRLAAVTLWAWSAAAAAAGLVATALTGSRASFGFTLALAALLVLAQVRKRNSRTRRRRSPLPALAAIALLAAAVATPVIGSLTTRGALAPAAHARMQAFELYAAESSRHELEGQGLGRFREINAPLLTPETAPQMWNFGAAHNAVLQAALEGGWPFAGLLVLAVLLVWIPAFVGARRSTRLDGAAALAAASLAGLCSMGDIALNVPAVATFAALCLGLAWGRAVGSRAEI